MTKHLIWLLVAALSGSGAAAPSSPAPWEPCADNAAVSCGTLSLPVDWSRPGGQRFDLAVARRPAADPVGTLVYLPAGPGSSGVDAVTDDQIFGALFPPEIAARFDIVGFDPRGVRRSHPVRCDSALVERLNAPPPRTETEFAALLDAQAAVGADCRARTGPLFDHLDSVAAARDVDALRERLGLRQLNLYALSYGTVIGQMYAERFPARIRTMVLDAVYDHSVDSDRFAVTGARAAQEAFDQFLAWCDGSTDCSLHGADIRARVAELFAGDESGELTYRIVAPLSQPNLPAAAAVIEGRPGKNAAAAPTPLPIYIQCADAVNRTTTFAAMQALRGRVQAAAPDVRGAPYDVADLCINPPVPATNPQRPLRAPDAPPIMVINSRFDPPTPYEGAQRVAAQLGRATLVTYDGMGHGAANRTDCTRGLVLRYLVDTTLPPAGTHCPALPLR
ncbi:alpha/beta hydrolase [Actinoplanes sp. NBRC 103695]|uniref:alpha/beta hydrolase n=1 Tax=Actinoplanes sp. NBRC 103695 TaxID=3032202 RepID=UPI0024A3C20D|nr:alpha/beta hydrolase [Actinoplanes sp. NBRC 103695]GLY97927.1 peptidase [Actinoplanes sp. NBRC 103695]